jgi:GNAT superfamily N-acetyltransferase
MLGGLSAAAQSRLIDAMRTIENLLGSQSVQVPAYILRPHQPGDMGWVVHRHGVLYAQEYRFDEHFEALVAEIVAKFVQNFDSKRERCWIAENDGEIVGSVFLVKHSKTIAKLRLLLVEPSARGLGIGKRLVEECIRFGRQAGYQKITLWTQSSLRAARAIYEKAGFRLVGEKRHHSWGHDDLVAETWDLVL